MDRLRCRSLICLSFLRASFSPSRFLYELLNQCIVASQLTEHYFVNKSDYLTTESTKRSMLWVHFSHPVIYVSHASIIRRPSQVATVQQCHSRQPRNCSWNEWTQCNDHRTVGGVLVVSTGSSNRLQVIKPGIQVCRRVTNTE